MVIQADRHNINGWYWATDKASYPQLPVLIETAASWDQESCADHPEPSRFTSRAIMPSVLARVFAPKPGELVEAFVNAQGINETTGAVQTKNVAYFAGYVDETTITRYGSDRAKRTPAWAGIQTGVGSITTGPTVDAYADGLGVVVSCDVEQPNGGDATIEVKLDTSAGPDAYSGGPVRVQAMIRRGREFYPPDQVRYRYSGGTWGIGSLTIPSLPVGESTIEVQVPSIFPGESLAFVLVGCELADARPPSQSLIEVTASDVLARFGRMRIGAEPFVWEFVSSRLYLLGQTTGLAVDQGPYRQGGYEPGWWGGPNDVAVRPLDVDSRSPLDVHRRTTAAAGRLSIAQHERVAMSWAVEAANTVAVIGGVAFIVPDTKLTSEIDTSLLPDEGVRVTLELSVDSVEASFLVDGTEAGTLDEKIETAKGPNTVGKTRRIETDLYWTGKTTLAELSPKLLERIKRMARDQAQLQGRIDNIRLITGGADQVRGVAELIDNSTRHGRTVRLVGPTPFDYPLTRNLRANSGRFGFSQTSGEWELELSLEPATYAAPESATFEDAATMPTLTLGSMTSVTFDQMRNVRI